jgi:predicted aconitase with swiveling domain
VFDEFIRTAKEYPMTAVTTNTTTRPLSASTDALLRFALRADATLTGLAGVAVAAFANPLSTLSGLSPTTEYLIGAACVIYGAVVYYLAALPSLRGAGIGVSLANVVSTLGVLAIVMSDAAPLTEAGVAVTLATGVYTAFFAYLQYLGVRRLRA